MENQKSLLKTLIQLWSYVKPRRRVQIYILTICYILAALSEAISLATLIPFITLLIEPTRFDIYLPAVVLDILPSDQYRIIYLACAYLLLVSFSGVVRLVTLWANNRISFMLGADISKEIYAKTLDQSYSYFLGKNSSQFVDVMTKKSDALISGAIIPVLQSIGAFIYVLIIISILLAISAKTTIFLVASLTATYLLVSFFTKKKSLHNGSLIAKGSSSLIKSIQEAMVSKKDLILNQCQDYFIDRYHGADVKLRRAESLNQFLLHSPKIILEIIAIVLMVILVLAFVILQVNPSSYIPVIAAFTLGAQRLLPSLQQIYAALSNIHARSSILHEVINLLSIGGGADGSADSKPYTFKNTLHLKDVCFQYPGTKSNSLNHVDLVIKKGERIGIQGSSGAGKSTLINVLLGLIEPTSGYIYCDNEKYTGLSHPNWYKKVSQVPQDVPMLDSTLLENIAYGVSLNDINLNEVKKVCELACIWDEIEQMSDGIMTIVGESGERLSGGQKQRIGIARALYKKAEILVLDEFTSALDFEAEHEIIKIINLLPNSITIITIAHREQALKICNRIVNLENGFIKEAF